MPVTYDELADAIAYAFRDYQIVGLPASGAQEPVKREIREALTLMAITLDDGGFSEPPDWAADLAATLAQLEDLEAYANTNASLYSLADTILEETPSDGQALIYTNGKWRNGGDQLSLGSYGSVITSPGVLLARNLEDEETDAAHGFVEATYFRRGGASAFAAFDAGTQMVGNNYNHYVAFQARPSVLFANNTQSMADLYGVFDSPTIDTGTVTNRYGVFVRAPTLANGGSIDNHYGIYVEDLEGDVSAHAFFSDGLAPSQFGGKLTVGTHGAGSVDPGVTISRNLFDGLSGSAHGFVEASYFRRSGNAAFASFDAFTTMAGNSYDHGVGFQTRMLIQFANNTQSMANLYGLFDLPTIDTGKAVNRYGAYISAPNLSNGGSIDNHYGIYVEDLSGTIGAWAFYAAGDTPSRFGGFIETAEVTAPSAPASNGARIYAEDNGSGKTRLMARFATGAAVQIAIEP